MRTKSTNNKQQLTTNSSKGATTMAQLLASRTSNLPTFKKRDLVKGIITKLTPSEILVDINGKSEASVLEKDRKMLRAILSTLKVGDEVTVSILNPESDFGNSVVSLRRFMADWAWKNLEEKYQNKEPVPVTVSQVSRGGLLVDTRYGISGFLPNSQVLRSFSKSGSDLQNMLGSKLKAYVLEVSRENKKLIFSQKPTLTSDQFSKLTKGIKAGQKIEAVISAVTSFGLFVVVEGENNESVDGLIHISEIAWEEVENIQNMFNTGQKITCLVIGIDEQSKRLELSIKQLLSDPFDEIVKNISLDQKVTGTVSKVTSVGVILDLLLPNIDSKVEAMIRREKIPPTVSYEVGSEVASTVFQIDKKRRRILLVPVLKEKPIGYK